MLGARLVPVGNVHCAFVTDELEVASNQFVFVMAARTWVATTNQNIIIIINLFETIFIRSAGG